MMFGKDFYWNQCLSFWNAKYLIVCVRLRTLMIFLTSNPEGVQRPLLLTLEVLWPPLPLTWRPPPHFTCLRPVLWWGGVVGWGNKLSPPRGGFGGGVGGLRAFNSQHTISNKTPNLIQFNNPYQSYNIGLKLFFFMKNWSFYQTI